MKFQLIFLASIMAALMSLSCSNTTDSIAEASAEDELAYNHFLLSTIYLHYEEIGALTLYSGKGNAADGEYADVVYMYKTISDTDYTNYYTPLQAPAALSYFMGDETEAYIGFKFVVVNDTMEVRQVVPNSPAEEAGLIKHDQVIKVNGTDVTGVHTREYSTLTKGGAGTSVVLTLKRGQDTLSVSVKKKIMTLPTVWVDTVENIPILQVDFFAASDNAGRGGTADEFDRALAILGNAPLAIIDLRGNPGGSVEECIRMTDAVLDTGIIIYELERLYDSTLQEAVVDTLVSRARDNKTIAEHREYIFLANEGSASCSEIMLAGIEMNKEWPIIGTVSFGKGIGQSLIITPAQGLAKITSLEFRKRNMDDYHKIGISPDIEVSNPDSVLPVAIQTANAILDTLGTSANLPRKLAKTTTTISVGSFNKTYYEKEPVYPNGVFRFVR